MGWVGVDLFMVLSGFLVSGLLFAEYKKFGNVKPMLFLIRRGFKIYPMFYASITITTIYLLFINKSIPVQTKVSLLISEIFFLQNYLPAFWGHHWSLALEEHFYLLLSFLVFVLVRLSNLENRRLFYGLTVAIFVGCLIIRLTTNLYISPESANFTQTHLRLDSLFAGSFIAYLHHFRLESLTAFFYRFKRFLYIMAIVPLFFVPFWSVLNSFFIKTVGFTLIYLAFACLLLIFLFTPAVSEKLKRILTKNGYAIFTTIGFYSYGIYLFHEYLIRILSAEPYLAEPQFDSPRIFTKWAVASFLIYFAGSIVIGIFASKIIEKPFLNLRDKFFPRRISN
jgi:peptidoglycan/LPS O-acetylase OafA/YrhL